MAYAFWKYDIYPYVLGGKVTDALSTGEVKVDGYGGYVFKPIHVELNDERGSNTLATIKTLEMEYKVAQKDLRDEFMKSFKEKLPELSKKCID